MIRNFNVKKGDQFNFTITFTNLKTDLSSITFGVKKDYEDTSFVIRKTLNNGIAKIEDGKYQISVSPEETLSLDYGQYVFDLRFTLGSIVKTPLSGYVTVLETVFE